MDAEIQFHLHQRADDLIARGVRPKAARRLAREEFGDALPWKEQAREVRGLAPASILK